MPRILFSSIRGDHPRVGGEKSFFQRLRGMVKGSPPRGRGKVLPSREPSQAEGITPAWAGKRLVGVQELFRFRDHPRVGGEKFGAFHAQDTPVGSPPRGRGKGEKIHAHACARRITPAWAGKRHFVCFCGCPRWDHPRMGGEKLLQLFGMLCCSGSPPHGRGKAKQ